jgi:hypothetical protein
MILNILQRSLNVVRFWSLLLLHTLIIHSVHQVPLELIWLLELKCRKVVLLCLFLVWDNLSHQVFYPLKKHTSTSTSNRLCHQNLRLCRTSALNRDPQAPIQLWTPPLNSQFLYPLIHSTVPNWAHLFMTIYSLG